MRWYDRLLLLLQGERVVDVLFCGLGKVWVTENPFCRCLRTSPFVIQTAMNKRRPWVPCSSHYRAVAEILRTMPRVEKFLMVGLGGGSFLHTVKHYYPNALVIVVEVDPVMVAVAKEYFDIPPDTVVVLMDAADYFSQGGRGPFDFVFIDAFDGMYPPKKLLTEQFFKNVARSLSPRGVVCMNTVRKHFRDKDYKETEGLFKRVFVEVEKIISLPGKAMPMLPYNVILVGVKRLGGKI